VTQTAGDTATRERFSARVDASFLKPDSQTPFSTLWAARLLEEAGVPGELVQVVEPNRP
jgi:acyl-CoA reductase-like NAD-dependent aldehyde dehydrogenase